MQAAFRAQQEELTRAAQAQARQSHAAAEAAHAEAAQARRDAAYARELLGALDVMQKQSTRGDRLKPCAQRLVSLTGQARAPGPFPKKSVVHVMLWLQVLGFYTPMASLRLHTNA